MVGDLLVFALSFAAIYWLAKSAFEFIEGEKK